MKLVCPSCGHAEPATAAPVACGGSKDEPHRPVLMVDPAELSGQIELEAA